MLDSSYLSWPFFEDTHRQLASDLDSWCQQNLREEINESQIATECRRLVHLLAEGGWLKYIVPAGFGGQYETIDVRSLCIIRESLARYCGLADFVFAMQGLGSCTISLFGSREQKNRYLFDVAQGGKIAAFALTERSSGSDVANLEMTAEFNGEGYRLNGEKTFISNGGVADYYMVFARSGEIPGAKGISSFIVDADNPGLDDSRKIVANAPHPLGTLQFHNCDIGKSSLVGEPEAGFRQAMATLDVFRPTVGAAALGFARRALNEATGRSLSREIFGNSLASNPVTQAKLAEMALDVDASGLLIYRAAWYFDKHGEPNTGAAAMAKLFATESAQQTIDKAVQLFGGLGVVRGVPVESLYREIRALRIYEGASEVQKVIIARRHIAEYSADGPDQQSKHQ